jgi:hypothetical protein
MNTFINLNASIVVKFKKLNGDIND